jgi:hypothetical protein
MLANCALCRIVCVNFYNFRHKKHFTQILSFFILVTQRNTRTGARMDIMSANRFTDTQDIRTHLDEPGQLQLVTQGQQLEFICQVLALVARLQK